MSKFLRTVKRITVFENSLSRAEIHRVRTEFDVLAYDQDVLMQHRIFDSYDEAEKWAKEWLSYDFNV